MATDNKYDRQLRLWGANGQKALSESCIVLIQATAVGTETLKNLVLPGIGSFHIIDDQQVDNESNGNGNGNGSSSSKPFSNFFVFPSSSGDNGGSASRAEVATQHLGELNPDVKGNFTHVDSLVSADYSSIFSSISKHHSNLLVIAADLPPPILRTISKLCWNGLSDDKSIPLIIVKSYGLIGHVRIQTPYHPIVESKPDNAVPDLRLASANKSFSELYKLVNAVNLQELDSQQHGHVPYVIILLKALEKWRVEKKGCKDGKDSDILPKSFQEKNDFKEVIKSMTTNWGHEVNFLEAYENAYLAYTTQEIPWEVEGLIDSVEKTVQGKLKKGGNDSEAGAVSSFDVLLLALKRFMKARDGLPPLNGSIPDMTASTQAYIELQGVYKTKAESDKDEMRNILTKISNEYGSCNIPNVTDDELAIFCKNIFNLRLTETRSYEQEYDFEYAGGKDDDLLGEFASLTYDPYEVPEHTPLLWHIALRACDAFYDENGHYPGLDSREMALQSDATTVQKHIEEIVDKLGLSDNEFIQSTLLSSEEDKKLAFAKEMTRYQNAEIHNIASVVGGVASQEAVKLITRQYVPMDGNYIFNGIVSVAGVCKL